MRLRESCYPGQGPQIQRAAREGKSDEYDDHDAGGLYEFRLRLSIGNPPFTFTFTSPSFPRPRAWQPVAFSAPTRTPRRRWRLPADI